MSRKVNFLKRTIFLVVGTNFFDSFKSFFTDFLKRGSFSIQQKRILHQIFFPASGNGFLVQWEKCFLIRSIFVLTIVRIREKQFSNEELILASEQMIFRLGENIFFLHFQRFLPVIFFLSGGKVFFNEILHFGQQKRILEPLMVSTNTKSCKQKNVVSTKQRF